MIGQKGHIREVADIKLLLVRISLGLMGYACNFNVFDKGQLVEVLLFRMGVFEAAELRSYKLTLSKVLKVSVS